MMKLYDRIAQRLRKICDDKPVILPVGLEAAGKTCMCIRLYLYLRRMGYSIFVDESFLSDDLYYRKYAQQFFSIISHDINRMGDLRDFYGYPILLKVFKDGKLICSILDVREYFYTDNVTFSDFVYYLRNLSNPLIFAIVADISEEDEHRRRQLVQMLYGLNNIRKDFLDNGNIIIVCTKVDREWGLFKNRRIDIDALRKILLNRYEGFSNLFSNRSIFRFVNPIKYKVLPFVSFYFAKSIKDNSYHLTYSEDIYPQNLWSEISKNIKKLR